MKKITLICAGLFLASMALGCQSAQTRAVEGTVIGGALGALGGGIIGHQSHHGGEGAAIGAAAGAVTGAIVGSQIKKPAQEFQASGATLLTVPEIVSMTRQGMTDAAIIEKIRAANSKFQLTADDITYLKQQGVSQKVIDAMQGK